MDAFYPLLSFVIGPLVGAGAGVWAYKKRAEVDAERDQDRTAASQVNRPLEILMQTFQQRDAKDREDRGAFLVALREMGGSMAELATDLKAHREEERQRSAKFYDILDKFSNRLSHMEGVLTYRHPPHGPPA